MPSKWSGRRRPWAPRWRQTNVVQRSRSARNRCQRRSISAWTARALRCARPDWRAPAAHHRAEELFPEAIQIVDRFQVKENLTRVSKALYPASVEQAHQWAQRRHQELDDGKWSALHKAVARPARRCEEARKCADYLRRNRHRM